MKLRKCFLLIFFSILVIFFINSIYFRCKIDLSEFSNQTNNLNYRFTINSKICHNNEFLVALVCISVDSFEQREIIRKSWANSEFFKIVFLVGSSLNISVNRLVQEENKVFMDIIQQDFVDSYSNLTLKTIMGLKWVSQYCSNVKYVLKVDDDVVVNVPILVSYLKNIKQIDNYYMGSFQKAAPVHRFKSKWAVHNSEYSGKCYPPYHQGPAYIISGRFVSVLFNISKFTKLFKLEDVYMGILTYQAKTNYAALNDYYLIDPKIAVDKIEILRQKIKSKMFIFTTLEHFWSIWYYLT